MAPMLSVTDSNFDKEVTKYKGVAVVDFFAEWCGPCKMMAPTFEKVAGEVKGARFGKLNVDEARKVASKFGVMSIPTLILFKNGVETERVMGVQEKSAFKEMIKKHLK